MSCSLLNFSMEVDWQNGCSEKIGSVCHKVVRNGALKSLARDTKRELALLLSSAEGPFLPAAQSSKGEMTRVTGNSVRTAK